MGRPPLTVREPYDLETLTGIALRLFIERGYDATSIADIAQAAGLSKSSIYHHIDSKDQLLDRAVNRALDALMAILDEESARTGPHVDRLRHVVARGAEVATKYLPEVTLLVRLRGNTEPEKRAIVRRREFSRQVSELVQEAQRKGEIRSDLDAAVLTRLLFGVVNSITDWYAPDGELSPHDVARMILTVTFESLGPSQPAGTAQGPSARGPVDRLEQVAHA